MGKRYANKRQYMWSAETAYCTGLMASDGCLQKDGRHLDVTSTDYEQLTNFCLAIGRELTISTKTNGRGQLAYRLQFSDVALYDFLIQAGLSPAKSRILGPLCVPDEYYFDFLRGVFDGDGCIRGFMDSRWANSLMFYTEFTSASMAFIHFMQETNFRLAGTTAGSIHKVPGAMTLSYAKYDSIKLAAKMFYNQELPSLARKRTKLFSFIAQHEAAIITRNARVAESVDASA